MSQMTLDLIEPEAPSFENFITGDNARVLEVLKALPADDGPQFVYLWGEPGAGKTHLLKALVPSACRGVPTFEDGVSLYAVDDVHLLNEDELEALFHLMNAVRAHPGTHLIVTGDKSPQALGLRVDVTSRLSWGLVFELTELREEEVLAEFSRRAAMRGIEITPEISRWIQTYCPRSMKELTAFLEKADHYALQKKRRVTIPLLHEVLGL